LYNGPLALAGHRPLQRFDHLRTEQPHLLIEGFLFARLIVCETFLLKI
jgi:hypothetical protein